MAEKASVSLPSVSKASLAAPGGPHSHTPAITSPFGWTEAEGRSAENRYLRLYGIPVSPATTPRSGAARLASLRPAGVGIAGDAGAPSAAAQRRSGSSMRARRAGAVAGHRRRPARDLGRHPRATRRAGSGDGGGAPAANGATTRPRTSRQRQLRPGRRR